MVTWERLAKNSEDRQDEALSDIEAGGGKLHGFWYEFGEFHGAQPVGGSGQRVDGGCGDRDQRLRGASQFETTALLTVEETLAARGRVETVR